MIQHIDRAAVVAAEAVRSMYPLACTEPQMPCGGKCPCLDDARAMLRALEHAGWTLVPPVEGIVR